MDIIEVLNPAPSGSIIDTHAHYDDERFDGLGMSFCRRWAIWGFAR